MGVYRSQDYGDSWVRIDDGLPHDFGFGCAVHATDPHKCYVIPLDPMRNKEGQASYNFRATDGALCVFQSTKRGTWRKLRKGLPQKNAYVSVLRQAMDSDTLDPCGVYFGTGNGQVFVSADEGASWEVAAEYLPPVYSVTAAVVEA